VKQLEQVLQLYREKYFDFNDSVRLHMSESGTARGGFSGAAKEPGIATQAPAVATVGGHVAA